jgi:hypothetical protein
MIEFYLGEKPILNNVPTYMCRNPDDLKYVLAHLKDLVVKEVHGAGGYGMLVGPAATRPRSRTSASAVWPTRRLHRPAHAEPVELPHLRGQRRRAAPHRPAALRAVGRQVQMVPGGLTRVALKEGSLVVNSSQGGGTKDTWDLGSLRERHAVTHRRPPVLDVALHRARREHRPHAQRQLPRPRCCPSRPSAAEAGLAGAAVHQRAAAGLHRAAWRRQRAQRDGLHGQRRTTPRPSSPACAPPARTRAPCAAR